MSLLDLSNVSVSLNNRAVVRGVSFSVQPGELVGLIGPNGAGKSTLLKAALGLLPATGQVTLGDRTLSALSARERALRAAYLPQERSIGWPVSVELLVSLGRGPHQRTGAALTATDRDAIDDALNWMDVAQFRARPATQLSGGEQARALIARTLAQQAPLLLADEPVAGLDPAHQISLMERLTALAATGRGMLVSLHDLSLAARWCSRILVLDQGEIVADGAPEAVLSDTVLRDVYGITAYRSHVAGYPIIVPTGKSVE